jgi:hypothetical protein
MAPAWCCLGAVLVRAGRCAALAGLLGGKVLVFWRLRQSCAQLRRGADPNERLGRWCRWFRLGTKPASALEVLDSGRQPSLALRFQPRETGRSRRGTPTRAGQACLPPTATAQHLF